MSCDRKLSLQVYPSVTHQPFTYCYPKYLPNCFSIPIPTVVTCAHATSLPSRISKCFGANLSSHIALVTMKLPWIKLP